MQEKCLCGMRNVKTKYSVIKEKAHKYLRNFTQHACVKREKGRKQVAAR